MLFTTNVNIEEERKIILKLKTTQRALIRIFNLHCVAFTKKKFKSIHWALSVSLNNLIFHILCLINFMLKRFFFVFCIIIFKIINFFFILYFYFTGAIDFQFSSRFSVFAGMYGGLYTYLPTSIFYVFHVCAIYHIIYCDDFLKRRSQWRRKIMSNLLFCIFVCTQWKNNYTKKSFYSYLLLLLLLENTKMF